MTRGIFEGYPDGDYLMAMPPVSHGDLRWPRLLLDCVEDGPFYFRTVVEGSDGFMLVRVQGERVVSLIHAWPVDEDVWCVLGSSCLEWLLPAPAAVRLDRLWAMLSTLSILLNLVEDARKEGGSWGAV